MAGANSREAKITAAMTDLGVYCPAFDDSIKSLAILERELSRARKQWKETAKDGKTPSFTDPLYSVITRLINDITSLRESLGLTPKGLRKLKGTGGPELGTKSQSVDHALDKLEDLVGGYELPEDCP